MKSRVRILAGICVTAVYSWPLTADAIDDMSTANGFFNAAVVQTVSPGVSVVNPAGYLPPLAAPIGAGIMGLGVLDSHSDATEQILDWRLPGALSDPYVPLDANRYLQLNLTTVLSGRGFDVWLLFWGGGTFLAEIPWLTGAGGDDLHPTIDVASVAPDGADQYFARFRLLPSNVPGGVLGIDSIVTSAGTSIPEPSSIVLGLTGLLVIAFGQRGRASRIFSSRAKRVNPRLQESI